MNRVSVLDHGYVELIESWGSDASVVEAARMSTNKGFLGWGPICASCSTAGSFDVESGYCHVCEAETTVKPGDEKLLRYLYEHKHATPFEMGGLVIEVQAPIFVFREWMRHRTQSYNEMSARYTPLPDLNYVPTVERLMLNSKTNKQAGRVAGADDLTEDQAESFRGLLKEMYAQQEHLYQMALARGVPKELARVHLPVGRYSRMRASANLRNWLAFLTLRCAPDAQWEIRQFAHVVADLVKQTFPRTHALWVETVAH